MRPPQRLHGGSRSVPPVITRSVLLSRARRRAGPDAAPHALTAPTAARDHSGSSSSITAGRGAQCSAPAADTLLPPPQFLSQALFRSLPQFLPSVPAAGASTAPLAATSRTRHCGSRAGSSRAGRRSPDRSAPASAQTSGRSREQGRRPSADKEMRDMTSGNRLRT